MCFWFLSPSSMSFLHLYILHVYFGALHFDLGIVIVFQGTLKECLGSSCNYSLDIAMFEK